MEAIRQKDNQIVVVNHDPKFRIRTSSVVYLAEKILKKLRYQNSYLNIVFETDHRVRQLNQKFLKHNWFTDVLAFPFNNRLSPYRKRFLGEIIISPKRAQVQAKHFGTSFCEELSRYVCHGILHLAGYRDKANDDKKKMCRKENEILNSAKPILRKII